MGLRRHGRGWGVGFGTLPSLYDDVVVVVVCCGQGKGDGEINGNFFDELPPYTTNPLHTPGARQTRHARKIVPS